MPNPDIVVIATDGLDASSGRARFWLDSDLAALVNAVKADHPKALSCGSALCPGIPELNGFDTDDLRPDADGVLRHVDLREAAGKSARTLIPFCVPATSLTRISAVSVLQQPRVANQFRGRLVFIGSTAVPGTGSFRTPVNSAMPRLEIEGDIVNGLTTGGLIRTASRPVVILLGSLLVMCMVAGLMRLDSREMILFSALSLGLPLAGSVLAVGALRCWAPPGAYLATAAFLIPCCGWRHLHVAGAEMVARLQRIQLDTFDDHLEPVLLVDSGGEILMANEPAQRFGDRFDVSVASGASVAPLLALIGLESGGAADEPAEAAWRGGLPRGSEKSVWHGQDPDGRPLEARFTPTLHSRGDPCGWIIHVTDVTARLAETRQGETALRQREEALQLLSHDMRSPQITILAMIAKGDLDKADVGVRHRVERQVRKTIHLAESFVRLAHAESDAYDLLPVDLGHLLEEAIDEVWALAKSAGVRLKLEPWTDEYVILADRSLIIRALINLLDNAIKFSPAGKWVVAGLARANLDGRPAIACSIADQAGGMDDKQLEALFTRFATFRRSADDAIGVGLGLATVRTVVTRHHGEVTCESALGVGSVFTITLPLCASPGPELQSTMEPPWSPLEA